MVYDDIFEAIKALCPNHPFLTLKDNPSVEVKIPKPMLFMLGVGQAPTVKSLPNSRFKYLN